MASQYPCFSLLSDETKAGSHQTQLFLVLPQSFICKSTSQTQLFSLMSYISTATTKHRDESAS